MFPQVVDFLYCGSYASNDSDDLQANLMCHAAVMRVADRLGMEKLQTHAEKEAERLLDRAETASKLTWEGIEEILDVLYDTDVPMSTGRIASTPETSSAADQMSEHDRYSVNDGDPSTRELAQTPRVDEDGRSAIAETDQSQPLESSPRPKWPMQQDMAAYIAKNVDQYRKEATFYEYLRKGGDFVADLVVFLEPAPRAVPEEDDWDFSGISKKKKKKALPQERLVSFAT